MDLNSTSWYHLHWSIITQLYSSTWFVILFMVLHSSQMILEYCRQMGRVAPKFQWWGWAGQSGAAGPTSRNVEMARGGVILTPSWNVPLYCPQTDPYISTLIGWPVSPGALQASVFGKSVLSGPQKAFHLMNMIISWGLSASASWGFWESCEVWLHV